MDEGVSDNYTCTVRNPWGEESGTWELILLSAPPVPTLRLASAHPAALHLTWDTPQPSSQLHS